MAVSFSSQVLRWFEKHGRKDLPWQKNINAYRVWVSEIMLQQTQVETVIGYYQRFMRRFPNLKSLATANQDDVLAHWAGLGYYARARNLHKSAQIIAEQYKGRFPQIHEQLQQLPGIGRSTAAAICAIVYGQPEAILDGNVKRVLARYFAVQDDLTKVPAVNALWDKAQSLMPKKNIADYTQAMMDLGATVCMRSKPQCSSCPLQKSCQAHALGIETKLPIKKRSKRMPEKAAYLLMFYNPKQQAVFLQQRPQKGIWGGLWCFPEVLSEDSFNHYSGIQKLELWSSFRHTFSHYHLEITPVLLETNKIPSTVLEQKNSIWYKIHKPIEVGVAKPVTQLLKQLRTEL